MLVKLLDACKAAVQYGENEEQMKSSGGSEYGGRRWGKGIGINLVKEAWCKVAGKAAVKCKPGMNLGKFSIGSYGAKDPGSVTIVLNIGKWTAGVARVLYSWSMLLHHIL